MNQSKYHNRRVELEGYVFDSASEARRYQELRLMEKAGDIAALTVHPTYELVPAFRNERSGRWERAITYEADFSYGERDSAGQWTKAVVEDVKGAITKVWAIKRKLFEYKFSRIYELRVIRA